MVSLSLDRLLLMAQCSQDFRTFMMGIIDYVHGTIVGFRFIVKFACLFENDLATAALVYFREEVPYFIV